MAKMPMFFSPIPDNQAAGSAAIAFVGTVNSADPFTYTKNLFVGQGEKIKSVLNLVDILIDDRASAWERTLVFTGEHGIGKSWLLREIAAQLGDKTYKHQEQVKTFFFDLAEPDFARQAASDPQAAIMSVLTKFRTLLTTVQPSAAETPAEMSQKAIREVHDLAGKYVIVALLDSVFESNWQFLAVLEDYLLGPLSIEPHTLIVMTGRGQAYPWRTPELRLKANFEDMVAFGEQETREQLAQLKGIKKVEDVPDELVKKTLALSNGKPYINALLMKYSNPIEALDRGIDDIIKKAIPDGPEGTIPSDEVVRRRKTMREYLEALCVLNAFDEERIMALLDVCRSNSAPTVSFAEARRTRESLTRLGFAHWSGILGGYVLDKATRSILEQYLRLANLDQWKHSHCAAYGIYLDWIRNYKATESHWRPEALHHHNQLTSFSNALEECEKRLPKEDSAAFRVRTASPG